MLKYFRRRRPTHRAEPAPEVSKQDKIIAAHHGLTVQAWVALPALAKADLRESVAFELRAAS